MIKRKVLKLKKLPCMKGQAQNLWNLSDQIHQISGIPSLDTAW